MVSKQIFDPGVCVDLLPSSTETLTFSKYSLLGDNTCQSDTQQILSKHELSNKY